MLTGVTHRPNRRDACWWILVRRFGPTGHVHRPVHRSNRPCVSAHGSWRVVDPGASAQQAMCLANCMDELSGLCEICRASDEASRIPIAGTSTVSARTEKLQVDLLFLEYAIALRAMGIYSR